MPEVGFLEAAAFLLELVFFELVGFLLELVFLELAFFEPDLESEGFFLLDELLDFLVLPVEAFFLEEMDLVDFFEEVLFLEFLLNVFWDDLPELLSSLLRPLVDSLPLRAKMQRPTATMMSSTTITATTMPTIMPVPG